MMYGILNEDMSVTPTDDISAMHKAFDGEDSKRRLIKQEDYKGFFISTVFLALNHAFGEDEEPEWFETMVFFDHDEVFCHRTGTVDDALQAHFGAQQVVDKLAIQKLLEKNDD